MKNLLMLFLLLFSLPAFASGIGASSASAPCTNNTLETYSGNTNLQADWQPNEIQLRWYNMNTQITPTNTTANTCVYDGSLAIPQNAPTRTGYTFAGWEVIPQYDFSTLPAETAGINAWNKNAPGYTCWYGSSSTGAVPCANGDFDDLNYYEWKVSFDYGMIYGMALCSTTLGTAFTAGTPDETTMGQYCWCRVTGLIPTNSDTKYAPTKQTKWVYLMDRGKTTYCMGQCADFCSARFVSSRTFRSAAYN